MHLKAPRIYEYFHGTFSRVDALSFTTNNTKKYFMMQTVLYRLWTHK